MVALISIKDVTNAFGSKIVHEHLNLDIHKGEVLALIGASGCGKSVLLRSLIGLVVPQYGSITFNGKNLLTLDHDQWIDVRKKIAYAFQGGALFDSLSVSDNLAFPLREHTHLNESVIHDRIKHILSQFGLSNTEHLYPNDLSGGMQKRLGVARAIMMEPEIILYDEPTAGLDPMNSRKISEMIIDLKKTGKTSVVVTHDLDCIQQVADRVAYIHQKKVFVTQSINDVRQRPHPLIKAYFEGQDPSLVSIQENTT